MISAFLSLITPLFGQSKKTEKVVLTEQSNKINEKAKLTNDSSIIELKGKVIDENSLPIPGAVVLITGTSIGIQTDFDGNFVLPLTNTLESITIRYLGYKTQ